MAKAAKTTKTPKKPQAASKSKAKASEPTEVIVTYNLLDLPTAFHKAGLAGLVLLLNSLVKRRILAKGDAKYRVTATELEITFTQSLLQTLMDDLYDARHVEAKVKAKWAQAKILRPPTSAEKEAGTPFIYQVVQPCGQFLKDSYPEMPDEKSWLKLWRDMVWNITRGRPTTREPYNQRAEGESCKEGPGAWDDLLRVLKARSRNEFYTSEISSALLPGAQSVNAEGVSFQGRAEENLLLHFWPLAVLLFAPQQVDADGSTEFVGYTLAVPEVLNLRQFTEDYVVLLSTLNDGLKPEHTARGFRPARSVIDLPAEGALALLDQLAQLTGQKVEQGILRLSIAGVEYLHLVKLGNNVKAMASGRVSPIPKLIGRYHELMHPKEESKRFRNPLFRRGLLVALLEDEPWYRPFSRTLATFDAELFVRQPRRENSEEKGMPQFANDALKQFQNEFTRHLERMKSMPEAERPKEKAPLPVIVNRVVRTYVRTRAAEKSGVKLEQFETDDKMDWSKVPADFNEAKQKLAQSLMLEFRSRKDQAFVDHFASTFFSVTQRIAEADRLELADALTTSQNRDERRDDLKTLTLLSLSANS